MLQRRNGFQSSRTLARAISPGRRSIVVAAALALLVHPTSTLWAQESASSYPSQPIRIVIPAGPGGTLDIIARVVGQKLTERLGQPVVIENKAGANTIIGTDFVAKAPPTATRSCARRQHRS